MTESEVQQVAVVVGGGSGIGAAVVRELSAAGYALVVLSPSGRGRELAESLGGVGLDGSNRSEDDLRAVVDLALATYGRIDVVVNNSGHGASGSVLDLTDADWQDGLEGYLLNVVRMARVVTPHLVEQGSGAIVNISTSSPFEPNPRYPVSATFRSGLATFTKLWTDEFGPAGLRMNNVLPGWTVKDPSSVAPEWTQRIPLRRPAQYAEIAKVVRFLASDEASYVTGQNVRADGGVSRSV